MDFIKEERSEMRKRGTSVEEKKLRAEEKGRAVALLPIGVFLVLFLGMGIVFGDFYAMPAIVAFLIALLTAFLQNGTLTFADKMKVISAGIGDENIITMSLIFLCAGGFSGAVTAAGGVESTVNLGLSVLPPSIAVVFLYPWEHPWERSQRWLRSQLESVKRQNFQQPSVLERSSAEQCLVIICP